MRSNIRQIADVQIGYQFRGKVESISDGSYKVIQIKDFDDENRLNTSELFLIKPENKVDRYCVAKGDVLFLSRGQRNFANAIPFDLKNTIAAGYFFILRLKHKRVLPEYLAWYINQVPAQRYLKNIAQRGSHMPIIGKSEFQALKIDIPDIKTQKNIIGLSELQKKEGQLLAEIQEKRSRLIRVIALKAVRTP